MSNDDRRHRPMIGPMYDPFQTGCLNPTCFTPFRAPEPTRHGDELTCPACGSKTVVIDIGRDPTRVEYLSCKRAGHGVRGVDHGVWCNAGGYCDNEYASWAEFTVCREFTDADAYAAVRWDWYTDTAATGMFRDRPCRTGEILRIVYVFREKGEMRSVSIDVTAADEAAAREYLGAQWTRLCAMWSPAPWQWDFPPPGNGRE